MFRKLLSRLFEGISFSVGILVVLFLLLIGVYAFSGPSQGPEAGDNYISSSSPISSIYSSLVGAYDSSSFSANSDGNVFERLEDIKDTVSAIDGGPSYEGLSCTIRSDSAGQALSVSCLANEYAVTGGCNPAPSYSFSISQFRPGSYGTGGWFCQFNSWVAENTVYVQCCS